MTTDAPSPRKPPGRPTAPPTPSPRRAVPAPGPSRVAFGPMQSGPKGHRIGLYGPGGIGKTTLAATAPGPVAFFDLDDSLHVLAPQLEGLDVRRVDCSGTWKGLRDALRGDGWDEIKTVVIDSASKAEELAVAHTIATLPDEKGKPVSSVEDYGWGKGYTHVYETFLVLLGDLDAHARAGRNVVLICHDGTATVPNPHGEDYIRFEPRLQSLTGGKASVRLRVREWLDHLLFIGYDIDVKKTKARGSGTRTIYPAELPHCMAKSRKLCDPLPLDYLDTTVWNLLLG